MDSGNRQSPRQAPLPDDDEDENESGGEGHDDERALVILRSFKVSEEGESDESDGGGEKEEASNNRDGDSSPMASINPLPMSKMQALQTIHSNLADYVIEELGKVDGSSPEQTWNFPTINQALNRKVEIEEQLHQLDEEDQLDVQLQATEEFLVTEIVGNKEVRANLNDWKDSIVAEYEQLVNLRKAVKPMTRSELQQLAQQQDKVLEILPAKMVHTCKAGSGAFRSRAVVCGNYQAQNESQNNYAGGADGTQVRAVLRLFAQRGWKCASTDIRTAFLNAPRRDSSRLVAMEVAYVFKLLSLASSDEVWVIHLAMYCLQSSPRDWCIHRDGSSDSNFEMVAPPRRHTSKSMVPSKRPRMKAFGGLKKLRWNLVMFAGQV